MDAWIDCDVFPGQFSGEVAVTVRGLSGKPLSLFASKGDVDFPIDELQSRGQSKGHIRVEIVEEQGQLAMVRLPRETLENGQHITVKISEIRQEA